MPGRPSSHHGDSRGVTPNAASLPVRGTALAFPSGAPHARAAWARAHGAPSSRGAAPGRPCVGSGGGQRPAPGASPLHLPRSQQGTQAPEGILVLPARGLLSHWGPGGPSSAGSPRGPSTGPAPAGGHHHRLCRFYTLGLRFRRGLCPALLSSWRSWSELSWGLTRVASVAGISQQKCTCHQALLVSQLPANLQSGLQAGGECLP